MDRSLYPDRVVVDTDALSFTESSKIAQILTRFNDTAGAGVVTGLAVAVGTNPTQLTLLAGRGYTSSGEEVVLPLTVNGIVPATVANGVANYVCLVYSEDQTEPAAHAVLNQTVPTRAVGDYRVRVFTFAGLEALVASSANMAVDAMDRVLICAVAMAGSTGDFQASNGGVIINGQFADTSGVVVPILSLAYVATPVVTGIVSRLVDPRTSTTLTVSEAGGTPVHGTITFTPQVSGVIASATLAWRAPGDAASSTHTVASLVPSTANYATPQTVTLVSDTSGVVLTFDLVVDMLPNAPGTSAIADSVVVYNVYTESTAGTVLVPRAGAVDTVHRHYLGSGVPSPTNPHGLRFRDLAHEVADIPQGIVLGTELQATGPEALVPRILVQQSNFGGVSGSLGPRTLLLEVPLVSSPSQHLRVYAASGNALDITINCEYTDAAFWQKDDINSGGSLYRFSERAFEVLQRGVLQTGTWFDSGTIGTSSGWTYAPIVVAQPPFTSIPEVVLQALADVQQGMAIGAGLGNGTGVRPRIATNATANAGGDYRAWLTSLGFGGGAGTLVTSWGAVASGTTSQPEVFQLTSNAAWNGSAALWFRQISTVRASMLEFGHESLGLFTVAGGAGSFNEAAWTSILSASFATGTVTVPSLSTGTFNVTTTATAPNFTYTTPVLGMRSITPGSAIPTSGTTLDYAGIPKITITAVSNPTPLYWAISVPNGVTLTNAVVGVASASGTATGAVDIVAVDITATSTTSYGAFAYSASSTTPTFHNIPLSGPTVDLTGGTLVARVTGGASTLNTIITYLRIEFTTATVTV